MIEQSAENGTRLTELEDDRIQLAAERYGDEFPGVDVNAIEVSLSLVRMARFIGATTRRHMDALNVGVGITDARFNLLITLYFTQGRRLAQNEISRELGVSRTNITNLIDGLERDGLVVRVANPTDRRVSHAQLTEEGERACREILPVLTQLMESLTDKFTPAEKREFRDYLRRFRHDLRDRYRTAPRVDDESDDSAE